MMHLCYSHTPTCNRTHTRYVLHGHPTSFLNPQRAVVAMYSKMRSLQSQYATQCVSVLRQKDAPSTKGRAPHKLIMYAGSINAGQCPMLGMQASNSVQCGRSIAKVPVATDIANQQ